MSFSKAKLKRFNEVTDSPVPERMERKDSIRRFLKEQFRDSKKSKENKENKDNVSQSTASSGSQSDAVSKSSSTETKPKSSGYRLFRTPSLPRRLRFNRQHSDLTPSKSKSTQESAAPLLVEEKEQKKKELATASDEFKRNAESIVELTNQINELQKQLQSLRESVTEKDDAIAVRETKIADLENQRNDCEKANSLLKVQCDESAAKVNVLETEIKTIVGEQDAEMNKLIQTNAYLDGKCDQLTNHNQSLLDENAKLKANLATLQADSETHKLTMKVQIEKFEEKDSDYRKLLDENIQLLECSDRLKKQADDESMILMTENQRLAAELDDIKTENMQLTAKLSANQELLNALQEELSEKVVEMDAERDEWNDEMRNELQTMKTKYEEQIATLKSATDLQMKEIESVAVLERAQLIKEHNEQMANLMEMHDKERQKFNETANEKLRIVEIQCEQKMKESIAAYEQAMQTEKDLWQMEIENCQKIAEREIMQCEFEKQDLKALLESANQLLRERDEKTDEMTNLLRNREKLLTESKEMQRECSRMLNERYRYQMALKNTRSTVTVLMARLQKSDADVEQLKKELDAMVQSKFETENANIKLTDELELLTRELEEYRHALTALRNSSMTLEREVLEKESVFEKIMTSEQETLETVNKIGKLFNDKLEENINKYSELYNDIKKKYDAREIYIKDMKSLLEEFATGIELARLELDIKDKQLNELVNENKNIQLENMTFKFKCEQFEKYAPQEIVRMSNSTPEILVNDCPKQQHGQTPFDDIVAIENAANDARASNVDASHQTNANENDIRAENLQLKQQLSEHMGQIEFLQEMVGIQNGHAVENMTLRQQVDELEQKIAFIEQFANETVDKYSDLVNYQKSRHQIEQLKEKNVHLKNKIVQLQNANKENEMVDKSLHATSGTGERTPLKLNRSYANVTLNTPKTPKTPKTPLASTFGKENLSPFPRN